MLQPNAECAFPDNNATVHLRALRPIAAGEEVMISYLEPELLRRSRNHRWEYLRCVAALRSLFFSPSVRLVNLH